MAFQFNFSASQPAAGDAPAFSFDFSSLGSAAAAANTAVGLTAPSFSLNPTSEPKKAATFADLPEVERLRLVMEAFQEELETSQKRLQELEQEEKEQGKIFELSSVPLQSEDEAKLKSTIQKELDEYIAAKVQLPEVLRKASAKANEEDLEILLGALYQKAEAVDFYGNANSEPSSCGVSDEDDDDEHAHCGDECKGHKSSSVPPPPPSKPEKPVHVPDQAKIEEWEKQIAALEEEAAALPGKKNYQKRKKINERIAELEDMIEEELHGDDDEEEEGDEDAELQQQIGELSEALAEIEEEMAKLKGPKNKKKRDELQKQHALIEAELTELLQELPESLTEESSEEEEEAPRGKQAQNKNKQQKQQPQQNQKAAAAPNKNAPPPAAAPAPAKPEDKPKVESKPAKAQEDEDDGLELDTSAVKAANKAAAEEAGDGRTVDIAELLQNPEKLNALLQSMSLQDHDDQETESDEEKGDDDSDRTSESSDWDKFPYEENLFSLGRFVQFISRIDTGRHMVVYKAVDLQTSKFVMVKIIDYILQDNRTPKEVKVLTALQGGHESVPQLVCWYALPKTECHAVVTSFFQTEDVNELVMGHHDKIQQYVKGVLEALQFIHSRNVIYRDVRPGNLGWNDTTRKVSLFNFEDATFFDPLRRHRLDVGYDGYQAPEILKVSQAAAARRKVEREQEKAAVEKAQSKISVVEGDDTAAHDKAEEEAQKAAAERRANRHKEVPPEGGYGPEVDVYSAGVVFGQLLFCAEEDDVVDEGNPEASGPGFLRRLAELRQKGQADRLTSAHALLERMLEEDPTKRISVADALAHPYFQSPSTIRDIIPDTASATQKDEEEDEEDDEEEGDEEEGEDEDEDDLD